MKSLTLASDAKRLSATIFKKTYGWLIVLYAVVALVAYSGSVLRSVTLEQLSYNEGWNVVNAVTVSNHDLMYPAGDHWVVNNYPALSFVLAAQLHHITHDYLFTGRALSLISLLALASLLGLVLRHLGISFHASIMAAIFCVGIFSARSVVDYGAPYATFFVGTDEPQILSLAFFATALWLYVRIRFRSRNLPHLLLVAVILTLGGSIKQTSIAIPIAIFFDLVFLRASKALWFACFSIVCIGVSLIAHIHWGGQGFLNNLLIPRLYDLARIKHDIAFFKPIAVGVLIAVVTIFIIGRNRQLRLLSILFIISLGLGVYFSTAQGVTINCFFDSLIAMSLLIGVFCDKIENSMWRPQAARIFLMAVPAWCIIWPMIVLGSWNLLSIIHQSRYNQALFRRDVAFLKTTSGPALCEDLLICYYAGKPYVYDPFNATRLIRLHRLDEQTLIAQIEHREFSAVEMQKPIDVQLQWHTECFEPDVLLAIKRNYHLAYHHDLEAIYVPNT